MLDNIIKTIFWDASEKRVKQYATKVDKINEIYNSFENFNLSQVKDKTAEYKLLFKDLDFTNTEDSEKIKTILDSIKLEAFALVKHTCRILDGQTFDLSDWKTLVWNMIPYDVQLVWALSIHDWNISEMRTWEWKTLVATLPAYLNALTWNTVHIVTVNDYLATRDSEEMGLLYWALWLTTWVITNSQSKEQKKESYKNDVLYATNNELGFDYLRDNMVITKEAKVQSPLFFAIIDEVDSILIDEARTPLIISMPDNEPTSKYMKFAWIAKLLKQGEEYKVDEKQKAATLTEKGIEKIEELLKVDNIYVSNHYNDLHHIENAIKATWVYIKDKDYLVNNWEVLIIDEHTGRVLSGRRYSEWLHQAIEAKEGVKIQQESKTLASITFQNYFRMYWKLSGMTGTAKTEEEEFYKVYALETLIIPTNKPIDRNDKSDLLFKNEKGKFEYVVNLIKEIHETKQPILVGTVSVDKSEYLSSKLTQAWVPHNVLNAKHHEKEAEVVASAGQKWAITIATNMAWRGTDIKLWEGVVEIWGLCIIGTEKHETRRIDNQLRGRAGRQWDPGSTQYLVSPNDDIMRIFGWDKLFSMFNSSIFASLPDDQPLSQSGMLTRKITSVQKQVEWHNFDIRKHVLQYDDVINKHREIIYGRRNKILDSENIDSDIIEMISSQISQLIAANTNLQNEEINRKNLIKKVNEFLWVEAIDTDYEIDGVENLKNHWNLENYIKAVTIEELDKIKTKVISLDAFYDLERKIVLQSIDELWMRHIDGMSKLRESVAFEWYAQRDPLVVYKEKAFEKFRILLDEVEYKVVKAIYSVDKNTEVKQVKVDLENVNINEVELENIINSLSKDNKQSSGKASNTNPLFASPNRWTQATVNSVKKQKKAKKKIRV